MKKKFTRVLLGLSGTACCRQECPAPQWLFTSLALCEGPFPAFTGNAHIGNRFFSDSWFEPKPSWNHSELLQPAHRKWGRNWGRGQLWNSSPSSYRVWGISFIIFSSLRPHIFSLSLSFALLTKLLPFPPRAGLMLHCWVLFGFSNVNTQEPAWAEELPQPQWYSEGSMQSPGQMEQPGPNINTTCDTPSQHAFKPSNGGS